MIVFIRKLFLTFDKKKEQIAPVLGDFLVASMGFGDVACGPSGTDTDQ